MFDKTSQTEEVTVFENQEDGVAEAFIEGAMEDMEDNAPDTTGDAEEKYTVKYNGEEVELSLDELKTNAQKGMNYDHIKNELDTLKNSEHLKLVEEMSKKTGKTPGELMKGLQDDINRREYERLVQNGVNGKDAMDILTAKNAIDSQMKRDIDDFAKHFPGIDPYTIPTEVFELKNKSGMSLGMAYSQVINNRLLAQLKTYEQNEKNARVSVGSALSEGASGQADPFLAGMMGY